MNRSFAKPLLILGLPLWFAGCAATSGRGIYDGIQCGRSVCSTAQGGFCVRCSTGEDVCGTTPTSAPDWWTPGSACPSATPGRPAPSGEVLYCDGSEDCEAATRCLIEVAGGYAACRSACEGCAPTQELCHEDQDCDAGLRCVPSAQGFGATCS